MNKNQTETSPAKSSKALPERQKSHLIRCRIRQEASAFWHDERGLGTLEIVIIIAVLLAVAMLFRENIMAFANDLISRVFNFSVLDGL